jgi:2-polyprenyl-6-methoxyphenol hydroxylase-like FAD-dependent oxidoreductase
MLDLHCVEVTGGQVREAVVIGGGPGGLYLAILLRQARPSVNVRVLERNAADHETFGFGVAFHEATLRKLAEADPVSRAALGEILRPWDDVAFHVRGREYRVPGHAFAGCSRHRLIQLLQRRAEQVGAQVEHGRPAEVAEVAGADLVVVADGSGSRNRAALPGLGTAVIERPNRFVWLGTTRPMAEMNFFFRQVPEGLFVAHAYPHEQGHGTWIVETDEQTFHNAGLEHADEAATVDLLQRVFADELDGAPLIARDSFWRRFPLIACDRWTSGNVALLGDAKATVHYSIGSGTKIAMEDAVALADALSSAGTVAEALARYEAVRRPQLELLQTRALGSMQWFENMAAHWGMDPAQFALSGVTRKTDETFASVRSRAPALAAAALRAYHCDGGSRAATAFDAAFNISGLRLPGRRVRVVDGTPGPGSDAEPADLAMTPPLGASDDPGPVLDALVSAKAAARALVIGREAASGGLAAVLDQAAACPVDLLIVDLSSSPAFEQPGGDVAAEAARALVSAARAAWPSRRPLGIRIRPPREPAQAVPLLRDLADRGCEVVAVAGAEPGMAGQAFVSDLIRHSLPVATICEGPQTRDAAETALVSGRADLVEVP